MLLMMELNSTLDGRDADKSDAAAAAATAADDDTQSQGFQTYKYTHRLHGCSACENNKGFWVLGRSHKLMRIAGCGGEEADAVKRRHEKEWQRMRSDD